jgi:hypothetical protein
MMQQRRFRREDQIQWRRNRVLQYLSMGLNQSEVADKLQVDKSTISKDVKYLHELARKNIKEHVEQRLPFEFEKTLSTFEYVKKRAFEIAEQTDDERIKIQALALAKDAAAQAMDLQVNGEVLDEALDFVDRSRAELERLEEEEEEEANNDNKNNSNDPNAIF